MGKYQSYKSSGIEWIGDIPEHWFCVGTNKVYNDLGTGTTPTSDNIHYYDDNGFHWITTTDLNEGVVLDTINKISDKSIQDYPNLRLYPPGSIFISMYGGKIGKLGISSFSSYCNQSVCVLPNNDRIIVKFYYYWFLGFQEHIKNMGRGGGQPNINKEMIKQFPTIKLPLHEQEQIVKYLDEKTSIIDKLISTKERKIELLKEQRTSLINEVITKGLNPNVKMKDSGVEWIGEIPEGWEVVKLNFITSLITDGSHFSPKIEDEGKFYISVSDITKTNIIDFQNCKKISPTSFDELEKNGCRPQKRDILLTKDGTIGRGCIVGNFDEFVILSSLGLIRLKENINELYIFYFLLSQLNNDQMYSHIRGSGITRLTIKLLKDLLVIVPTFNEQQEIVEYLDKHTKEIDDLVGLEQRKIELLKEYRQSLISEVITGKIKVVE